MRVGDAGTVRALAHVAFTSEGLRVPNPAFHAMRIAAIVRIALDEQPPLRQVKTGVESEKLLPAQLAPVTLVKTDAGIFSSFAIGRSEDRMPVIEEKGRATLAVEVDHPLNRCSQSEGRVYGRAGVVAGRNGERLKPMLETRTIGRQPHRKLLAVPFRLELGMHLVVAEHHHTLSSEAYAFRIVAFSDERAVGQLLGRSGRGDAPSTLPSFLQDAAHAAHCRSQCLCGLSHYADEEPYFG